MRLRLERQESAQLLGDVSSVDARAGDELCRLFVWTLPASTEVRPGHCVGGVEVSDRQGVLAARRFSSACRQCVTASAFVMGTVSSRAMVDLGRVDEDDRVTPHRRPQSAPRLPPPLCDHQGWVPPGRTSGEPRPGIERSEQGIDIVGGVGDHGDIKIRILRGLPASPRAVERHVGRRRFEPACSRSKCLDGSFPRPLDLTERLRHGVLVDQLDEVSSTGMATLDQSEPLEAIDDGRGSIPTDVC